MPRMKFTYHKDSKHPILSAFSYICGFIYALCLLFALSCSIAGTNMITGNRWLDALIFLGIAVIFTGIQFAINTLLDKRINSENTQKLSEHNNEQLKDENMITETGPLKKKRYCKFCGNEIEPSTKKCTGCGKQYFNFKKMIRRIAPAVLIISLICNVILSVMLYQNHEQIIELDDELQAQYEKAEDNEEKAQYLDNNIVFTTASGESYHSYGCQYIQGRYKFIWFIADAVREGYKPCSVCQKNSLFVY